MTTRDVHLVSYPKSGRTWLRLLISKYLSLSLQDDTIPLEDIEALSVAAGISKVLLTHASANLTNNAIGSEAALREEFANARVIFLTRSFEDTLVSAYHQAKFRKGLFDGTIGEFIRSDELGAKRLLSFYQIWASVRQTCSELHLVRYEDMHADTHLMLAKALRFAGVKEPNPVTVDKAVEFCAFENLQKLERNNYFSKKALQARDTEKIETYKFREGGTGNFTNYLDDSDLEFIYTLLADVENDLITHSGISTG